ncbi:MAG: hypothetical protein ACTSX7_05825 [Alphaproteobacteria bacterium]
MNTKDTEHYPGAHWQRAVVSDQLQEAKAGVMAVLAAPYVEPNGNVIAPPADGVVRRKIEVLS